MAMRRRLKIFFDGGCRPNPGRMEAAIVAGGETRLFRDLGQGTSQDAEWLALIQALRIARDLGASENPDGFVLIGDSASVIRQAQGDEKARGDAARHLAAVRELSASAALPRLRHVRRGLNPAGIALARLHGR